MLCSSCEKLNIEDLCEKTRLAAPTPGWSHGYLILHSSYQELDVQAQSGCRVCKAFQEHFINAYGSASALTDKIAALDGSPGSLPVILFLDIGFSQGDRRLITKLHLQIGTQPQTPGVDRLAVTFRVSKTRDHTTTTKEEYGFRFTQIDHDLGSDGNFAIARSWVEQCCSEHQNCVPVSDNDLPTRLIDVGSADSSEEPRLVEVPKGKRGRYLALSHCWGPSTIKERLLTTKATIDVRMKAIPMASMPANFSDATVITRKLGYRYLWIDSLCIIQDSTSDWEAESQNMGNIYTNAALTIAAAAAKDSDGGMLRKDYRPEQSQSGGTFEPTHWFLIDRKEINNYAWPDAKPDSDSTATHISEVDANSTCNIKIRPDSSSALVILEPWMAYSDLEENWFRCTAVAPLAHRGWCLQERLLSHRVIFYGARQIYWQCASLREAADGEIVPLSAATSSQNLGSGASEWPNILGLIQPRESAADFKKSRKEENPRLRSQIERSIYKTWHNVLYLYVNRRLTYQTDKLPGLAGMAALVGELTGDEYHAGLWRKYLIVSLVWTNMLTTIREFELRSIAERYEISKPQWELEKRELEGPSWSCMSADIKDKLDFLADHDDKYRKRIWEEHDAKILDVKTELLKPSNRYGRVKSGRLILRAFTFTKHDVRTSGWDPWDAFSSLILSCCPHSPWNIKDVEYRPALWDYSPRQKISPFIRMVLHIFNWLIYVLLIVVTERRFPTDYGKSRIDMQCPACMQYLQVHMLSLVDKIPKRHGKSEEMTHEVDLSSLILEQVAGEAETYRRIGINRRVAYLSEDELAFWTDTDLSEQELPKPFSSWRKRTVTII